MHCQRELPCTTLGWTTLCEREATVYLHHEDEGRPGPFLADILCAPCAAQLHALRGDKWHIHPLTQAHVHLHPHSQEPTQ